MRSARLPTLERTPCRLTLPRPQRHADQKVASTTLWNTQAVPIQTDSSDGFCVAGPIVFDWEMYSISFLENHIVLQVLVPSLQDCALLCFRALFQSFCVRKANVFWFSLHSSSCNRVSIFAWAFLLSTVLYFHPGSVRFHVAMMPRSLRSLVVLAILMVTLCSPPHVPISFIIPRTSSIQGRCEADYG